MFLYIFLRGERMFLNNIYLLRIRREGIKGHECTNPTEVTSNYQMHSPELIVHCYYAG